MRLYNLFNHENQVLHRVESILNDHQEADSQLYAEYKHLADEYRKFLREMEVIFSISDNNHKMIKDIQQKLEEEINEKQRTEQELETKIRQLYEYKQRLEGANEKLLKLSSHDELTSLPNRRRFEEYMTELRSHPHLSHQPVSVIMIDIDFFKNYNDKYGHIAGDKCLKRVADLLTHLPRGTDFVARYGGEEFIIVLPATIQVNALKVAERVRESIEDAEIIHEESEIAKYVTVSLGVTTVMNINDFTTEVIVDSADQALYQAKKADRNNVKSICLNKGDDPVE